MAQASGGRCSPHASFARAERTIRAVLATLLGALRAAGSSSGCARASQTTTVHAIAESRCRRMGARRTPAQHAPAASVARREAAPNDVRVRRRSNADHRAPRSVRERRASRPPRTISDEGASHRGRCIPHASLARMERAIRAARRHFSASVDTPVCEPVDPRASHTRFWRCVGGPFVRPSSRRGPAGS